MAETSVRPDARARAASDGERAPIPRWKIVLCVLAGCLLVGGVLLGLVGGDGGAPSGGQPTTPPGLGTALVERGPEEGGSAQEGTASRLSPGLTMMGFSFFVGFALGYALRAFLSLVLLVVGILLLAIAGLAHLELITVHWDAMEGLFDGFARRVESDFQSVTTAVTGRLPQAGLGGLGLVAGLKKR